MLLFFALFINVACTALNVYWFQRALRNRDSFPLWYLIMTGIFALYCGMNTVEVLSRL